MIKYEILYNMLVDETARFILGAWDNGEYNSEDFEELMADISKCFYNEDGSYSSASTTVRATMKSIENVSNPFPDKILMLRNSMISVLFTTKYDSFPTPGELYVAWEKYKEDIDLAAAICLRNQLDLTDTELKSLQDLGVESPAMIKLDALLMTKKIFYIEECIKYLRMIK